jgi:soluble lytic murein transglycosylase-like protein
MPETSPVNLKSQQGAPAYVASETIGGGERVGLEPTPIPRGIESNLGTDVAQVGEAVSNFADKLLTAKTAANATTALSSYLLKLNAAKEAQLKNPDWQNAPAAFNDAARTASSEALIGPDGQPYHFDEQTSATLRAHFQSATIAAGNEVNNKALSNGADKWLADYQTQAQFNQNAASTAGSDIARNTAITRNNALILTGVNAGWISQAKAVDLQRNFQTGLDHAQVMGDSRANPAATIAKLADPANYPTLTAPQRETYRENARDKIDTDATERARGLVAGRPYVASLTAGQFVDSGHVDQLFDNGVVPAESKGQNAPPNAKGAFGPAQITPGFARDYAGKLPAEDQAALGDITKLSDQELTDKLMALPKVSTDIGRLGFRDLANKYGGNPVLAMAAYNAGPKNADRWQADAQAKFGANPTPAQILSVIDFPETQKYVAGIYKSANAPTDAFGVSPAGRYHLGITLGTELQEQQARDGHVINQLASVSAATDPVPKLVDAGMDVGADRIAAYRNAQLTAAQNGDPEAARRLHELDLALQVKPQVDRLYRLPFGTMNGAVDAAEAQARLPGADVSADQVHTLEVLKKTRDEINRARTQDPTSLLVRAGLSANVPLDTAADPNDQNFRAALTMRGGQATMAQKLYGGTAVALTPAEQTTLKERYAAAPPQDQFKMLKTLADTLPTTSYNDTVKTILGDVPGAEIIGRFAADRPDLAQQMLNGASLMKSKDAAATLKDIRPVIGGFLKGQLYPTPDQQNAVVEASLYLDASRRNDRGALYDTNDTTGVQKAIEDVAGALTSRNGVQVAAPIGMRAGQFNAMLDGLNEKQIALSGGAFDRNGNVVTPDMISRNAVLKQTVPGSPRYWVGVPDASARDGFQPHYTGGELPQPLIFDMREIAANAGPRVTEGDTLGQREAKTRAAFADQ